MYDFNMNVHVYEMHDCDMQMYDFVAKMFKKTNENDKFLNENV